MSFASGTWMGVFQQLVSARLRSGDFIFIFTVMSHDRLVACQMVVSCFGYIYMYTRDQEIWES